MRGRYALAALVIALVGAFGGLRVVAQDEPGTPAITSSTDVAAPSMAVVEQLVERAERVTTVDLDPAGPSIGDMIVWGPDPLYDAANAVDTGATTQGVCVLFQVSGECIATESIAFPDGSTLEIQGVQAADALPSSRTIVGGSGQYLGATGTVTVEPSADLTVWTKTFEFGG